MKSKPKFNQGAFYLIDFLLMNLFLCRELILATSNTLGHAWWAEVETLEPKTIYLYGPFLSEKSLESSLKCFLDDIYKENISNVSYKFVKGTKTEPLTFSI